MEEKKALPKWLRFRRGDGSARGNPPADQPVTDQPVTAPPRADAETAADRGRPASPAARPRAKASDTAAVSRPVRTGSEWAWRFLVIAAAVAVLGYVVARFSLVVFPIVVALLLAALLQPAVARLRSWGVPRGLAAAIVFVSGIAVVVGTLVGVGTLLAAGIPDISANVLQGIDQVRNWLTTGPLQLSEQDLNEMVAGIQRTIQENQNRIASGALATAGVAVEIVAGVVLVLFVTFFFLYDGDGIWRWCVRLFPRGARTHIAEAGQRAWATLGGYVRGIVLVAAFDALFIAILLLALRVPLVAPLAMLVFLGAFVPLVGAIVTGAIAVLVALVSNGLITALVVLGGIILIQQIEGNVLQPFLLGRMVKVHALAVVLVVTAGAIVGGIAGAVIAVPLAAVLNSVLQYFANLDEDAGEPAAPR